MKVIGSIGLVFQEMSRGGEGRRSFGLVHGVACCVFVRIPPLAFSLKSLALRVE